MFFIFILLTLTANGIQHDYIVQFNGYYTHIQRQKIINFVFEGQGITDYLFAPHSSAFSAALSDFELVKLNKSNGCDPTRLQHRLIKRVRTDSYLNQNELKRAPTQYGQRHPLRAADKYVSVEDASDKIENVTYFHEKGVTGKGIKVAVFDTGLNKFHRHFRNIAFISDFTGETSDDFSGHGTFVASVSAGSGKSCPGIAPDADVYIFRVFNAQKISRTSWFLDAFNVALRKRVDILNLSIGGPDFTDQLFVEKVQELVSTGIIFVSAIGNDGPVFGTLNNPADQPEVIGVGAYDKNNKVAAFSSRGMTTWELPGGYGRAKPDVLSKGVDIHGATLSGGCTVLQGTSVAAPIVSGAIALWLSTLSSPRPKSVNPAMVKQSLMLSSSKIPGASVFEQGSGRIRLLAGLGLFKELTPKLTLHPSYIDTTTEYFWPYSQQAIYFSKMPTVFNITIINSHSVTSRVEKTPYWVPERDFSGLLQVNFQYPSVLWPWGGYLAVTVSVTESGKLFNGILEGNIYLTISSYSQSNTTWSWQMQDICLPVKMKIDPQPSRSKRVLIDHFHNIFYPHGYFPRDDLNNKKDLLDWTADHPHTNFKSLFDILTNEGYYVEVLGEPLTCFDAGLYGVLIILDPEEEYFTEESDKLWKDFSQEGLSIVVVADWWNQDIMSRISYYDENTRIWKYPLTGGSNVPALNGLLNNFNVSFSNHVYNGLCQIGPHALDIVSGSSLVRFPESGFLIRTTLNDQLFEIQESKSRNVQGVPIGGVLPSHDRNTGNFVAFADSSCLESSKTASTKCFSLFLELLQFALSGSLLPLIPFLERSNLPETITIRRDSSQNVIGNVSKVLSSVVPRVEKPLPKCQRISWVEESQPSVNHFDSKLCRPSSEIKSSELLLAEENILAVEKQSQRSFAKVPETYMRPIVPVQNDNSVALLFLSSTTCILVLAYLLATFLKKTENF